jgi:hypothetical protein
MQNLDLKKEKKGMNVNGGLLGSGRNSRRLKGKKGRGQNMVEVHYKYI